VKIPRDVSAALKRRTKAAEELSDADTIVTRFIEENGIDVSDEDYCTGYEMYANPYASEIRVREAIKAHKERK
jgi:hypothetical protein